MQNVYLCCAFALLGLVTHFVLKLGELEKQGTIVSPWEYWRQHPYTSLSVILMVVIAVTALYSTQTLNYYTAAITGFAANSLGDKLRARADALK